MTEKSELSELQGLLAHMGMALAATQLLEQTIRQTLLLVIQEGPPLDMDGFLSGRDHLERRMLGQLIAILQARADLGQGFEARLEGILRDRNVLAHHHDRIAGYDPRTAEGRAAGHAFFGSLIDRMEDVIAVFLSFQQQWKEQAGMRAPVDDTVRRSSTRRDPPFARRRRR